MITMTEIVNLKVVSHSFMDQFLGVVPCDADCDQQRRYSSLRC